MDPILLSIVTTLGGAAIGVTIDRWLGRGERKRSADDSKKLDLILAELRREGRGVVEQRDQAGKLRGVQIIRPEGIASSEAIGEPTIIQYPPPTDR